MGGGTATVGISVGPAWPLVAVGVVAVLAMVGSLRGRRRRGDRNPSDGATVEEVQFTDDVWLQRFARGEIDAAEYESRARRRPETG
ncbi:hypothetical protein PU560_08475 [Georgenia sp. 10Sc9-8]|uniref:SHOCT domain-containing protein n=1 Tax=Georgenia halotolerans TaxID=3028317 RepID=A0ABT5U065_9MICO|nr:hypothetical protein [Georgenia halotolerans]